MMLSAHVVIPGVHRVASVLKRMETILAKSWLALIVIALTGCDDVQETGYSDVATARFEEAFERGWLPEPLPASARQIREAHNLDTNQGWLTLQYSPDEEPDLDRLYTDAGWSAVATERHPALPLPDPPVSWWPDRLRRGDGQVPSMRVYTRADEQIDHQWWVLVLPDESRLLAWHARR